MSLVSRINRLIDQFGTNDDPRNILIWYGPHFEECWIEWGRGWGGNDVSFHVKTPDVEVARWIFSPQSSERKFGRVIRLS